MEKIQRIVNTAVGILGTLILLMIIVVVLIPILQHILAGRTQSRVDCLANLKQIMSAIKVYTEDYDESYPTSAKTDHEIDVRNHYRDLAILYPEYVPSLKVFACPNSGDRLPRIRITAPEDGTPFHPNEAKQVSYAYGYNGQGEKNKAWTQAAPSETRVLADRPGRKPLRKDSNHKLDGRSVAYADGHVKWVSAKGKLLTNPDHPDSKMRNESWWSER